MNLVRCIKGHFYNADKYDECPHCLVEKEEAKNMVSDDEIFKFHSTASSQNFVYEDEEKTVDIKHHSDTFFETDDEKTVGLEYNASSSFYSQDNSCHSPESIEDEVTERFSESDNKYFNMSYGGEKTSLHNNLNNNNYYDEDDQKTVSFYGNSEPVVGWLVCVSGQHYGEDFKVRGGMNYVGRSPSMDIALVKDQNVSRNKHITIIYEPKARKFTAYMGESRELVYVNDELLIAPRELEAYDKIVIGKSKLILIPLCGENFSWDNYRQ